MNFDISTDRILTLADLFKPGAPYLQVISDYCIRDLQEKKEFFLYDKFQDAALAKPENYAVWNITPKGLLIIFNEYTVAPYSSGTQYVLVPYEMLKKIIDPQGAIGEYVIEN